MLHPIIACLNNITFRNSKNAWFAILILCFDDKFSSFRYSWEKTSLFWKIFKNSFGKIERIWGSGGFCVRRLRKHCFKEYLGKLRFCKSSMCASFSLVIVFYCKFVENLYFLKYVWKFDSYFSNSIRNTNASSGLQLHFRIFQSCYLKV